MLNFFEARERVLAAGARLGTEKVTLGDALGRVLAENLRAPYPLPEFDYSAMDGYAARAADVNDAAPAGMEVVGESRAGDAPSVLPEGRAMRIFTGAPLPMGADCVVIQENAERRAERVLFTDRASPNQNVRRAGEDLARGALALTDGTRLGPFHLGLAASLDRAELCVARRPRVAIVATGNELATPGARRESGKIPESNSVVIAALARRAGAAPTHEPILTDDLEGTSAFFSKALSETDVLVTLGGVSVGDHDVVRPALERAGATLEFWKVAIKPGKPLVFGRAGRTLVLGLPGNPASAQSVFSLFGVPLLRALQGDVHPSPTLLRVKLSAPFSQKPGRLGLYRARLRGSIAELAANQASGSALSLAQADAIVFAPAETAEFAAGTELDAVRLEDL